MNLIRKKYDLACARACLSTKEVAKKAGIPRATIDTCLNRGSASVATIGKIARALGVDVLDILEDEKSMEG